MGTRPFKRERQLTPPGGDVNGASPDARASRGYSHGRPAGLRHRRSAGLAALGDPQRLDRLQLVPGGDRSYGQVVGGLEVDPELRRGPEYPPEAQGGVRGDRPLLMDDAVHPGRVLQAHGARQRVGGKAILGKELLAQVLPRMRQRLGQVGKIVGAHDPPLRLLTAAEPHVPRPTLARLKASSYCMLTLIDQATPLSGAGGDSSMTHRQIRHSYHTPPARAPGLSWWTMR